MEQAAQTTQDKPPVWVYIVSGWPFVLVAFGGAIGGALGGAAFATNFALYKKLPLATWLVLSVVTGGAAILGWYGIARVILG